MLGPMHTASPAATAAPWLVPLVVVLVVAGAVLIAGALAVRARSVRPAGPLATWHQFPDDDLMHFAAFPPGCGAETSAGSGAETGGERRANPATGRLLAVTGVVALLAAAALTVVATGRGERTQATHAAEPETARLRFGGVVLEQRAVGVTVTYPDVTVRVGARGTAASVRLPTFNCLADAPPADPMAAGCVRSLEEFADLRTPQLTVIRGTAGALRLSGSFPTYTRPNGSPPEPTGRIYALTVTVQPIGTHADGEIRLGSGRTTTADGNGVSEFRSGG